MQSGDFRIEADNLAERFSLVQQVRTACLSDAVHGEQAECRRAATG